MKIMTFKDYVDGLSNKRTSQRREFISKIAKECGVDESTVYRWIKGDAKPQKTAIEKIAEIVQIPSNTLFDA